MPRKVGTHCRKGHALSPGTIIYKACCAACNREIKNAWMQKQKALQAAAAVTRFAPVA
jgi:hypothetical protein